MNKVANPFNGEKLSRGDQFWEHYLGKPIVTDFVTAIVKLIANLWDSGANELSSNPVRFVTEPKSRVQSPASALKV
jgi:hypothetical protein